MRTCALCRTAGSSRWRWRLVLSLGDDLEEQFGAAGVELDVAELVEQEQVEAAVAVDDAGQLPVIGGLGAGQPGRLLAAYPPATEEAWRTTVNLAKIQTPNRARNQIPALAEAWLDIRYPPDDTNLNGKTIPEIAAYLASFCQPGVTPVVEHADPPHHADQRRPEIRSLQQAVTGRGYRPDFLRKHGAADGRFYYQQGTDAVIFGIGGDGLHGPDEYADITTIAPYYQALKHFLHNPAGH